MPGGHGGVCRGGAGDFADLVHQGPHRGVDVGVRIGGEGGGCGGVGEQAAAGRVGPRGEGKQGEPAGRTVVVAARGAGGAGELGEGLVPGGAGLGLGVAQDRADRPVSQPCPTEGFAEQPAGPAVADQVGQVDGGLEQDGVAAVAGQVGGGAEGGGHPPELPGEACSGKGGRGGFVGRGDVGDCGVGQVLGGELHQVVGDPGAVGCGGEARVPQVGAGLVVVGVDGHRVHGVARGQGGGGEHGHAGGVEAAGQVAGQARVGVGPQRDSGGQCGP